MSTVKSKQSDQWITYPSWTDSGLRQFESAETTRLNSAHWVNAADESVNVWLESQLSTMRARANYECHQNGIVLGMVNTHANDVVGQDGPTLQVISESNQYNDSLEQLWRDWFSAPTPDPNISGVSLIKQWIRSLWKNGEFLSQLVTDPLADGAVKLRIKTKHPRLLESPMTMSADENVFMGIRFNSLGRPIQYYIADDTITGTSDNILSYSIVPADLVLHCFLIEEDDQRRGIPWLNTTLAPAADLRDYDDQVQDAARQIADQNGMLYTEHPDITPWTTPESITVQRRTIKTMPPGWKPFVYPAVSPPVQYPEYRAERQREFGRPVGMPLATIRLDYSGYNYSSARLETQNYQRSVSAFQTWISGTSRSTGTLNRLADALAAEGRFTIRGLRIRPDRVSYQWTWPQRPHVDPSKESRAEGDSLANGTTTLIDVLASRGNELEQHIAKQLRVRQAYADAGLTLPEWTRSAEIDKVMSDIIDDTTIEAIANAN